MSIGSKKLQLELRGDPINPLQNKGRRFNRLINRILLGQVLHIRLDRLGQFTRAKQVEAHRMARLRFSVMGLQELVIQLESGNPRRGHFPQPDFVGPIYLSTPL